MKLPKIPAATATVLISPDDLRGFYVSGGPEPPSRNIYGLSSFYVGCLQKQVSYEALTKRISIGLRCSIYLL